MDALAIRPQPHRWIWIWIWIASVWFGFGLVDATQTVIVMRTMGMHHAWMKLFVTTVISWLPWTLATAFVMRLGRRFPPVKLRPFATCPAHLAACASIGLIFAAWTAGLDLAFNPYAYDIIRRPFAPLWFNTFFNGIPSYIVLYIAILAFGYVIDSRVRLAHQQTETARLNEQLSKAQLDALRRQIEPHFLFNSLNAVAGLVSEKRNDDDVTMIAGLSDFLRRIVSQPPRAEVSLQAEVELTQLYLHVQQLRFAERLQTSVDVPEQLLQAQVPSLLL